MTAGPGAGVVVPEWRWIPPHRGVRPPVVCELCGGPVAPDEGYWIAHGRLDEPVRRRHAECHDPDGTA